MTKANRGDFYSGIPWVNVAPQQARAHPKGKLNLVLWAIVAYFIGIGSLKFGLALSYGAGFGIALLNGIWPFLTGIGLALRVPWAIIMATIAALLTIYALVRSLGGDGSLVILLQTLANVGILFYLVDGDRPNLIYRHRYRQYSADKDAQD